MAGRPGFSFATACSSRRRTASARALGIGLDGTLDVRRVSFFGTWRGTGQRRALNDFNDAPGKNGISLFTSDWGRSTPRVEGSFAVVLAPFPASVPNTDIVAPVVATAQSASVPLAPGTAVLVARGNAAAKLQAEAAVGIPLTLRLILQPDWTGMADAVGGGPVLVRDGKPVYRANEGFTVSQIAPRHPRTAVGQLADGRLIFVVVDGRQPGYSIGMTTYEMALTLTRLGAVRGMQLDGGGSSTLAFDGKVLNSPSDGRERPVPTALMLQYYGVFAPPPLEAVVSPNGDGVAETQKLSYKIVRPSTVTATLTAPDGSIAWQEADVARAPGTVDVAFPPLPLPPPPPPEGEPPPPQPTTPLPPAEGRWALTISALDDQGLSSTTTRRFTVNSTLALASRRSATRRRSSDRWQGRHPLGAVTCRAREGDDRDTGRRRRPNGVDRAASARRAVGHLGRPRRQSQAGRWRALRRQSDGDERARRRVPHAAADRSPSRPVTRPTA